MYHENHRIRLWLFPPGSSLLLPPRQGDVGDQSEVISRGDQQRLHCCQWEVFQIGAGDKENSKSVKTLTPLCCFLWIEDRVCDRTIRGTKSNEPGFVVKGSLNRFDGSMGVRSEDLQGFPHRLRRTLHGSPFGGRVFELCCFHLFRCGVLENATDLCERVSKHHSLAVHVVRVTHIGRHQGRNVAPRYIGEKQNLPCGIECQGIVSHSIVQRESLEGDLFSRLCNQTPHSVSPIQSRSQTKVQVLIELKRQKRIVLKDELPLSSPNIYFI
mmetsp:Transcript_23298/g.45836  ORF Transcript_23298/g.45836 Transcript_23298/m.45836 type:complete len:270 (+) Transcript_23298:909-1718(+)